MKLRKIIIKLYSIKFHHINIRNKIIVAMETIDTTAATEDIINVQF